MQSERPRRSEIVIVKLWLEGFAADEQKWRGKIQHVTSGEVRYFQGWPGLLSTIQEMVSHSSDPHFLADDKAPDTPRPGENCT